MLLGGHGRTARAGHLTDWEPCFDVDGDEISPAERTRRREAFLRAALDDLDR
jgi:hypothetical protein